MYPILGVIFLITKTDDEAVLFVKKQLQGSSTFDFYWVSHKLLLLATEALQKYLYKEPSKKLFKILLLYDSRGYV